MAFKELEDFVMSGRIGRKGVFHVGAHLAQELPIYQRLGFENVAFVEADKAIFDVLQRNLARNSNVKCYNVALSSSDQERVPFYVTNNQGKSSSLLQLKLHKQAFPYVGVAGVVEVSTLTLDSLMAREGIRSEDFNVLVTDVQGADLDVMKGAINHLKNVEAIVTEINITELYEGCALLNDVDRFLEDHGFERKVLRLVTDDYGDALYVKRTLA